MTTRKRVEPATMTFSGPVDQRAACESALTRAGFLIEATDDPSRGLPSHPDPLTAHAMGAPNSGHTPGTLHPAELHYTVGRGDHDGCTVSANGKPAKCEHVGQTEVRPNPLTGHIGEPYEPDDRVGFVTVYGTNLQTAGQAALSCGWVLRCHADERTALEIDATDEQRLVQIESDLAALRERVGVRQPIRGGAANTPPFVLQSGSHSAQLFRQALSTLFATGGGAVTATDMVTRQNFTPNMSIIISGGVPGGQAFIPGTTIAGVQGLYYGYNDGTVNLTIAASSPSNPRIDVAIAQVQDAAYAGVTNSFSLAVVTGTPAGSPVAPAIPASSLALANVAVAANTTSILNANITDQRVFASVAAGIGQQPLVGWTALTLPGSVIAMGGQYVPAVRVDPGGAIRLRGVAQNTTGGAIAAGGTWATIPGTTTYRPTAPITTPGVSYQGAVPSLGVITVAANGGIVFNLSIANNGTLVFDGITFA